MTKWFVFTGLFLLLFFLFSTSYSQKLPITLFGEIKDSKTKEPVPFAHIVSSAKMTVSNSEGKFKLQTQESDTVYISHLNYEEYIVSVKDLNIYSVVLLLTPKQAILEEVIIEGYLSEEIFKEEILELHFEPTQEQENAEENIENATGLFLIGFTPAMNSMDNYRVYTRGPKGVSLLSSNPSKGLIKAIKNISRQDKMLTQRISKIKTPGNDSATVDLTIWKVGQ